MTMHERAWIAIGALNDIPMEGARVVKTPAGCVAVFRTADDQVFAVDDRCPHLGGPLSQGIVHGTSVTCPLHAWVISLNTGIAEGADEGEVRTHALKVEDGKIFLDGARLAPADAA
ncbi:MAG: nitrite reductase small subunit NirD [Pseudomonadota bacterium]